MPIEQQQTITLASAEVSHPRVRNHTGKRFGKLTVRRQDGTNRHGKAVWLCSCDCGGETRVVGSDLTSGHTRSCGCLHVDEVRSRMTTHGQARHSTRSSLYHVWSQMKSRCTNPKNAGYPNYGGRGIRVCDEWARSFEAFAAHMGERPSPAHSIDRIDNDGNYEPGNVRWATPKEQRHNRRPQRGRTEHGN